MGNTRILLVDDEAIILKSFSALLQDIGYLVETASTPDTALSLVEEINFDIAFLDQFLGSMTGLDLMAGMAEIDPELYYVIITANGNTELAVDALKKGASDFISKPFFLADLIKSIDYVNRQREMDRQKKDMVRTLEARLEEKTEELKKVYFPVLASLAAAMEKKDTGTHGHSMRVRRYSDHIAAALHLGSDEREQLKVAAMLHDIGKIGMSDFILAKAGPLNRDEINNVRSHPRKGVEILKPLSAIFPQLDSILPAILHHHESFDGSGYPEGLSGEDIPLLARIIAVADTYDAIMSDRPYRPAAKHDTAVRELLEYSGRQFDNGIVTAFVGACSRHHRTLTPL
jgi:putative nucleotidyltransferase with HDIG domain